MEEQRTILARKTYALDTAWWRGNYCVKLAKTTSYIQYRLIQQSPRTPPVIIADKLVGLSYPKFALLATRGLVIKTFIAEQRKILARKTYSLDAAW